MWIKYLDSSSFQNLKMVMQHYVRYYKGLMQVLYSKVYYHKDVVNVLWFCVIAKENIQVWLVCDPE